MLGFSQLSKRIKWQHLLEKGKKRPQCVSNRCKDSFKKKKYFGVRGTLMFCYCQDLLFPLPTLNREVGRGSAIGKRNKDEFLIIIVVFLGQ